VNKSAHREKVQSAQKELDVLLERINSVLIALNLGMSEAKGRELLIMIERDQRRVRDALRLAEADIIRRLLEELEKKGGS
jgi:hypothetical protein